MFVQKSVFSDEKIARDVLAVLGASGKGVAAAFDNARSKDRLMSVFSFLLRHEFVDTDTFEDYHNDNKISFISFEKALRQMEHFTVDSTAFADDNVKRRKLYILLESLEFIEAGMMIRLVQKRFDVEAVSAYLFPKPKVKKPAEVVEE